MYNAYFLLNPRRLVGLWDIAAGNSESHLCPDSVDGLTNYNLSFRHDQSSLKY